MKEVISSAAHGTEVKIPGCGYITSDRFLTNKHVRHIEDCIKFRTLSPESVAKSMTQGIQISPQQPDEFILCLEEYRKSRDKIPLEKYMSCFSFFGFTKKTKLSAAMVLINILKNVAAGKEISPTQYDSLKQHTSCLKNGTLGKLVRYNLKTMGIESLQSLNVKCTHNDGPQY